MAIRMIREGMDAEFWWDAYWETLIWKTQKEMGNTFRWGFGKLVVSLGTDGI
jgi:hypothetical protein